jgi:hypothetical protein
MRIKYTKMLISILFFAFLVCDVAEATNLTELAKDASPQLVAGMDGQGNEITNVVIDSANISIALGTGSPTVDQIQEYLDNTGSSGFFLGGTLSDGGAGTLDVAAGSGFIRTTADSNAPLVSFKWSASSGIAVPDDTAQYVYVDDTGAITLSTNEFLEAEDNILIGVVIDEGAAIETAFNLGVRLDESIGQAGRFMRRAFGIVRDERRKGLIFGETGTRNITLTDGRLWFGRSENIISALDTSVSGGFDTYSASGKEATGATQWPNTQYDNAGTLTTMTNNKWAVLWFYIELDDTVLMVYGRNQYNSEAEADKELKPSGSLPPRITAAGRAAARFTFQESASTTASISSLFDNIIASGAVSEHGNLAGLSDDDHIQYLLNDGTRALSGPWNMGNQAITNVNIDSGTINGITTFVATGTINGLVDVIITTDATLALTAAQMAGNMHVNGDADVIDYTLPGAAVGLSACFYAGANANVVTIDPVDGTDTIFLDGVSVGAGDAIDSAAGVSDYICLFAADATNWHTMGRSGTWVDGGVD